MQFIRNVLSLFLIIYFKCIYPKYNTIEIGNKSVPFLKLKIKGKNNTIKVGKNSTLKNTIVEIKGSNNMISIGNNVSVYEGLKILIESNHCEILINDKTTIGSAKLQLAELNTKISIGSDCMLSREITINASDFHSIIDLNTRERINPAKNVIVGDHVWVGNGCYLNKGVQVGDNSVIAARSVLSGKKFEKNIILGGVPAKLIRSEITWDRKLL